jgi:hypothetical protein
MMFLMQINTYSAKVWWLFLIVSLIYMAYSIRHINDDTLVKNECILSVVIGFAVETLRSVFIGLTHYIVCDCANSD